MNEVSKETISREEVAKAVLDRYEKSPKFRAFIKRDPYFHEANHEVALLNVVNSGCGRKHRRTTARKMGIDWALFMEYEDYLYAEEPDKLSSAAKKSIKERHAMKSRKRKNRR